jgi:hypothetical protein
MRIAVMIVALVTVASCGGAGSNQPSSAQVVGTWTLQTYNGSTLPYTGSANPDSSVNRVNSGSMTFASDAASGRKTYLLDIRIVNTKGTTVHDQNYSEVGSYAGDATTGLKLDPNDLSGGTATGGQANQLVPATISGNTLSFSQNGKPLTFVKR